MANREYEIVLDGGANIAVVPYPPPEPVTAETKVRIYHRPTRTWRAEHTLGAVIAHGNYWEEPLERTVIRITEPQPV